jgi:phospholipase/carboxylesterase
MKADPFPGEGTPSKYYFDRTQGGGPARKKTPAQAVVAAMLLSFTSVRIEPVEALPFTSQQQSSPLTSSGLTGVSMKPPPPHGTAHPEHVEGLIPLPNAAVAYIPPSAPAHPPLLVLLHGAGHRQAEMIEHFEPEADKRGIVLLAPDSRGITWDKVLDAEAPLSVDSPLANMQSHSFGRTPDADRVEQAIADLAKVEPVDRARTVLAGFSDGATFALAMGMSRAYPFAAVIAWSPGIAIRTEDPARGRPVYISHGRQDPLLKFDVTCNDIVPPIRREDGSPGRDPGEGAKVTFVAFDGGHDAPVWLKDEFLDAVFGSVAGSQAHELPPDTGTC